MEDWAEIRRLYRAEGLSRAAIARRLSLSRNTVAKALGADAPPRYERASSATSAWAQVEPAAGTHLKVDVEVADLGAYDAAFGTGRSPDCLPSVPPQPLATPTNSSPTRPAFSRRRASPSTTTGWQNRAATQAGHWRTTSVPYSPWNQCRAESGARQRIRHAGFPAIKTISDFDFTAQPSIDRAQIARLEAGGWLAEARNTVLLGPPGPAKHIWPPHWVSPQPMPGTASHSPRPPDGSPDSPKHTAPTDSMPNYARSPATDSS